MSRSHRSSLRATSGRGFTLIELLIVIAIITVIAGLTVVAVFPLITKSKLSRTIGAIRMAESGVERFQMEFPSRKYGAAPPRRGYPRADELGLSATPPNCDGEFLRMICSPTDDELAGMFLDTGVKEAALEFNVIKEYLNSSEINFEGNDYDPETIFVDGWDQPLRYIFAGRNHSLETNYLDMKGNNHFQAGRPDIWSVGADGVNFYAPGNEGQWPTEVNNPSEDGTNDDVGNWFNIDEY